MEVTEFKLRVHLSHTSMGRTYTLNKKDSKMEGDAMKKKL